MGDAPIKVQHSSGREIGVNIKYLANPFGIKYKLNGFELGVAHPFQIRVMRYASVGVALCVMRCELMVCGAA